MAQPVLTKGFL